MDLKALKTFQTIVACGSFNKAAEEMSYAQSTVTMQIRKLEEDMGIQLFERGRRIRLTEAGRMLYEQSVPIVKAVEQLQNLAADTQAGEAGSVRLGVTEPSASHRLPQILGQFFLRYPRIRVSVEIGSTASLSGQLLRGELDLVLGSAPSLDTGLYFEQLFTEKFILLVPDTHPLAAKSTVSVQNIRGHRMLITSKACPYRMKLEMLLQETGLLPVDTMEIGSMGALKYYVQQGMGIALIPQAGLNPPPSGTRLLELQSKSFYMACGLLCKADEYPLKLAGGRMYQFLKEELSSIDLH
jgi:LysR family transcriptional regulator, regulator of the ytmI operon